MSSLFNFLGKIESFVLAGSGRKRTFYRVLGQKTFDQSDYINIKMIISPNVRGISIRFFARKETARKGKNGL